MSPITVTDVPTSCLLTQNLTDAKDDGSIAKKKLQNCRKNPPNNHSFRHLMTSDGILINPRFWWECCTVHIARDHLGTICCWVAKIVRIRDKIAFNGRTNVWKYLWIRLSHLNCSPVRAMRIEPRTRSHVVTPLWKKHLKNRLIICDYTNAIQDTLAKGIPVIFLLFVSKLSITLKEFDLKGIKFRTHVLSYDSIYLHLWNTDWIVFHMWK